MVRVVGAISASALRRWCDQRFPCDAHALQLVPAASLVGGALLTVWRSGEKCHQRLCRTLPVLSGLVRECLYRAARTPAEHDSIARLDIAKGLTSFHVTLRDTGMHLRIHTRLLRLLPRKPGIALWCTWPVLLAHGKRRTAEEDEDEATASPYAFYCSAASMDVARFAQHQYALAFPSSSSSSAHSQQALLLLRYECETTACDGDADDAAPLSSWSRGTVTLGAGDVWGVEFYRVG